jgi:hypothetical protein
MLGEAISAVKKKSSTAIESYRAMEIASWVNRAEAALSRVG